MNKFIIAYLTHSMTSYFSSSNIATNKEETHKSWNISKKILVYKKCELLLITNYKPIALPNTTYKLYTSTLTPLLKTIHDEQYNFDTTIKKVSAHNETPHDKYKHWWQPLSMQICHQGYIHCIQRLPQHLQLHILCKDHSHYGRPACSHLMWETHTPTPPLNFTGVTLVLPQQQT